MGEPPGAFDSQRCSGFLVESSGWLAGWVGGGGKVSQVQGPLEAPVVLLASCQEDVGQIRDAVRRQL